MNRSNETRSHWRRLTVSTTAALLLLSLLPQAGADDSLARSVPADVGLFVEVRGVGDLLTALTEPQVWATLAELAGQPARPQDVAGWRLRIRQTVKMDPDEAIRVLFARGVAFVGEGLGLAQDAVVLCRPAQEVSTAQLLRRWNARRLRQPPRPPTYRLYSNIGVTEHRGLLFFGDLLPPEGLFARMQRFAAGARPKSLADDPVYKKLLARVPPKPDGVLFARLEQAAPILVPPVAAGSQPSTQPAVSPALSDLPAPFRNAENVMLALHRDGPRLHFTAVGDANGNTARHPTGPLQLLEKLPERTLLAWEGRVDFSRLAGMLKQLPEHNPVRGVFALPEHVESLDRFAGALGTDACVAVGPVSLEHRRSGAPPLPAVALLLGTRDPRVAAHEVRNVVNVGMAGYLVFFALPRGLPLLEPIREVRLGATSAFVLELSPLLKPTARAGIGELHLCWSMHGNVLILASHLDWLRQIVAAREGQVASLSKAMQISPVKPTPSSANTIVVQSGSIADLGTLWLKYLERSKPEVFDEEWWRSRQPGGGDVRLGINVIPDVPNRRLRIERVYENQPADGHLEPGDFIVGYENRRFATNDPMSEIRTAIQDRPHARWMELLVERKGPPQRMRLPLPFIDPIQALQRVVAIGKIAQRAVYHDDHSDPAGPRGFLTIELRSSEKPLFEFTQPVPIKSTDDSSG